MSGALARIGCLATHHVSFAVAHVCVHARPAYAARWMNARRVLVAQGPARARRRRLRGFPPRSSTESSAAGGSSTWTSRRQPVAGRGGRGGRWAPHALRLPRGVFWIGWEGGCDGGQGQGDGSVLQAAAWASLETGTAVDCIWIACLCLDGRGAIVKRQRRSRRHTGSDASGVSLRRGGRLYGLLLRQKFGA